MKKNEDTGSTGRPCCSQETKAGKPAKQQKASNNQINQDSKQILARSFQEGRKENY